MNLELLDPFRRQIPDRVDATLSMPAYLHIRHLLGDGVSASNGKSHLKLPQDEEEWKAAYHVAYNRRGTYVAVGYASGLVGVHDVLSRTLTAIYRGDPHQPDNNNKPSASTPNSNKKTEIEVGYGVSSVSWSRRSRTLLAGAVGDSLVKLYDTTHPHGPEECTASLVADDGKDPGDHHNHEKDEEKSQNPRASPSSQLSSGDRLSVRQSTFSSSSSKKRSKKNSVENATEPRRLTTTTIASMTKPGNRLSLSDVSTRKKRQSITRYHALHFHLPGSMSGSLEVHPRYTTGGLAVLSDGSLVLFWIPESAWWEVQNSDRITDPSADQKSIEPSVRLWKLWSESESNATITCAAFDPQGQNIYAATKEGKLLGFEVGSIFDAFVSQTPTQIPPSQKQCSFTIRIPGGATVWHLIVSRDGKMLVLNCADGALRLYTTKECWQSPEEVQRPVQVFQDVVNKVKFVTCAISGDAEYVVGGANGISDDKYELYIWNASTGALMDKLTGAPVQLYSIAWHPTRSFLAVATSDGLIDVWGPRINWTAFAPDFQALPMNVEYVEREDEFDLDEDGNNIEPKEEKDAEAADENAVVDVVNVEPVPVFASDSEEEEEVFHFETKFANVLGGRAGRHSALPAGKAAFDDG